MTIRCPECGRIQKPWEIRTRGKEADECPQCHVPYEQSRDESTVTSVAGNRPVEQKRHVLSPAFASVKPSVDQKARDDRSPEQDSVDTRPLPIAQKGNDDSKNEEPEPIVRTTLLLRRKKPGPTELFRDAAEAYCVSGKDKAKRIYEAIKTNFPNTSDAEIADDKLTILRKGDATEQWEFRRSDKDPIILFTEKEEIKKELTLDPSTSERLINTRFLYRAYSPVLLKDAEKQKSDWRMERHKPKWRKLDNKLFNVVGLSVSEAKEIAKKEFRDRISTALSIPFALAVFILISYGISEMVFPPATNWFQFWYRIGAIAGGLFGLLAFSGVIGGATHPIVGILAFVVGVAWLYGEVGKIGHGENYSEDDFRNNCLEKCSETNTGVVCQIYCSCALGKLKENPKKHDILYNPEKHMEDIKGIFQACARETRSLF